jgi:hypothetical protein
VIEPSLKHIPFGPEEERMISSMSRWMNIISVVIILSGLLMTFAMFLFMMAGTVMHGVRIGHAPIPGWLFSAMGLGGLIMAGGSTYAGMALRRSADELGRVATTDTNDQLFLEQGLENLKIYFKTQILMQVGGFLVGFLGAMVAISVVMSATGGRLR